MKTLRTFILLAVVVLLFALVGIFGCEDPRYQGSWSSLNLTTSSQAKTLPARKSNGQGQWAQFENWAVHGDSHTGICVAIQHYDDGMHLSFAVGNTQITMNIAGPTVEGEVGEIKRHFVVVTGEEAGMFTGYIIHPQMIVFPDLDQDTINIIGASDNMAVAHLGYFPLEGISEALFSAMSCHMTLSTH